MQQAILKCEICREEIGTFNPATIHLPITSDQFGSKDPKHGFPLPFPTIPGRVETYTWEAARCPYCHKRPFIHQDKVLTPDGHFHIGVDNDIPRKRTLDDERQDKINEEWEKFTAEEDAGLSVADRNQAEISRVWAMQEEEDRKDDALQSVDRILDQAAGRGIFKRRPGRPRRNH